MLALDEKGKKLDPSAGVSELKKVGTQMKQGEPLMMIHYNDESRYGPRYDVHLSVRFSRLQLPHKGLLLLREPQHAEGPHYGQEEDEGLEERIEAR